MQRGDDPDRTRRADQRDSWQTGNHRRGSGRDPDPATRRHGRPDDPDATRRAGPGPGPQDPGATRRVGPGDDPGATRRVGPGGDPGATRRVGPGGDPGATRWTGAGADPGATRRVDPGEEPTREMGHTPRAARAEGTRMLPQPVGGPELLGGRYRLEGLIGQGGMADVHRATDTRLNRPVAVKIFGPGNDPTADQRFQQEAQVMANLSHPGLVGVHDFAVEPNRAYLVMELVDGPTLREVIESEQLPADEIRQIGLDVAQTLDYVHSQGVTHRDVKPSNILIGSDGRARLADFGIASLLGADGHTAAGEIIGTPAYLAPEQIRGGDVGPPADIYALGLVLLEAWTGRKEYQGEGIEGASERLTRAPVVPRDTPPPLNEAITEMTATDPRRRPSARNAAALLSASEPAPAPDVEQDGAPRPGQLRRRAVDRDRRVRRRVARPGDRAAAVGQPRLGDTGGPGDDDVGVDQREAHDRGPDQLEQPGTGLHDPEPAVQHPDAAAQPAVEHPDPDTQPAVEHPEPRPDQRRRAGLLGRHPQLVGRSHVLTPHHREVPHPTRASATGLGSGTMRG